RLLSREAWVLLERGYQIVLGAARPTGSDAVDPAWADMLLGAHLAGAAIEASMLGAAHACANPLTSRFRVTHGVAVGLMLPAVVRANGAEPAVAAAYGELIGVPAEEAGAALA